MSECKHCQNGWLGERFGGVECVNGVLIDIDEATEGWARDTAYPPAPCQSCDKCGGDGCQYCGDTGWRSGTDESQERLDAWSKP